jgi:hypothetical protein
LNVYTAPTTCACCAAATAAACAAAFCAACPLAAAACCAAVGFFSAFSFFGAGCRAGAGLGGAEPPAP